MIRRVYSYVAYRLGEGPEAEDVTSEVFERALRYRKSFDRRRGEPVQWLLGIARKCVDGALAARPPLAAQPPELEAPGDLEQDSLLRLELREAFAELSEHDRELLAFRYGADLTSRQIAELLGQRTNTVEVGLHRALERLRRRLEREEPSSEAAEPLGEGVRV
ncbi:MAG: sigma-70 family RNA polymerase sigma factor [Gaiellaceae bacterium]